MVFDIHSEDTTGPSWFVTVRSGSAPIGTWVSMGWVDLTPDGVRVVRDPEMMDKWRGRLGTTLSEHPEAVAFVRSLILRRASDRVQIMAEVVQ